MLLKPITALSGVGTKRRPLFERLLGSRVVDALMHLPCDLIHRYFVKTVAEAKEGDIVTVVGEVINHRPPVRRGKPYYVTCFDGRYFFDLVFFQGRASYLESVLPLKSKRLVTGKLERFQDKWKIVHPDYITNPEGYQDLSGPEPVYPLTTGVTNKCVRRVIKSALPYVPILPEWLDAEKARLWPPWNEAISQVHAPQTEEALDPQSPARLRLAYDELLAHQLSIMRNRHQQQAKRQGIILAGDGRLRQKLRTLLPFSLTGGQEEAIAQIGRDMASPPTNASLGARGCRKRQDDCRFDGDGPSG